MPRYLNVSPIPLIIDCDGQPFSADGLAPQVDAQRGWVYVPVMGSDLTDSWWEGGDIDPDRRPPFLRFAGQPQEDDCALVRVADLKVDDRVDLEGDLYADPDHAKDECQFEFGVVSEIERETAECIAVTFESSAVSMTVGFPPDHLVRRRKIAPEVCEECGADISGDSGVISGSHTDACSCNPINITS